MALKYYKVASTGLKGFVTHEDNERAHVSNYPGDIWVTENEQWAARVGADDVGKDIAQSEVNAALNGQLDEDGNQIYIALP